MGCGERLMFEKTLGWHDQFYEQMMNFRSKNKFKIELCFVSNQFILNTTLKTNVWNQNFDILQIHCCNFVTVHLQLSLPIYCSNLKVFLWRLYFIPTILSCSIHFIRTIQSKQAAREHWYKFRGLCLSLLPPLRSEYTGAGVRDGQETVVMIWCTELYSTVQYCAVRRCWERAGDGRIGTNISGQK